MSQNPQSFITRGGNLEMIYKTHNSESRFIGNSLLDKRD
jgi:hypothetical protein